MSIDAGVDASNGSHDRLLSMMIGPVFCFFRNILAGYRHCSFNDSSNCEYKRVSRREVM